MQFYMEPKQKINSICTICFSFLLLSTTCFVAKTEAASTIDVGVILNLSLSLGLVTNACIAVSHHNYYAASASAHTRPLTIVLNVRNSAGHPMAAASAALELITSVGVKSLLWQPAAPDQTDFLANIATQAGVPLIALSPVRPLPSGPRPSYLVDMDPRDSSQSRAISALIKAHTWTEVTLVHDDTNQGTNLIPYLSDALQDDGVRLRHCVIGREALRQSLHELAAMKTRVFVVHISFSLAETFFQLVHELGMMSEEYVWIVTSCTGNLLSYMDASTLEEAMQGVLVIKNHVPSSAASEELHARLKRKTKNERLDVYSLWAYDAMKLLAEAIQRSQGSLNMADMRVKLRGMPPQSLVNLEESPTGRKLLDSIISTTPPSQLSGKIRFVDQQLAMSDAFEIVNIVGSAGRLLGYWSPGTGLCRNLHEINVSASCSRKDLAGVVWPGGGVVVPSGTNGKIVLNVLVPKKKGFHEFVDCDNKTGHPFGFSVSVFKKVMQKQFPSYQLNFTIYPRNLSNDLDYYNQIVTQIQHGNYDVLVGDVTITAKRSEKVDFSQPYIVSDVGMIVQLVDDSGTNTPFWFFKPLSLQLWMATFALFVFKGILVWVFEYTNNPYKAKGLDHLLKILSLSFTIFVLDEREKLRNSHAKFVVFLWMVVFFIVVTGYAANLTSMLTVENLRPKVTDLDALIASNESIGYQGGGFVEQFLIQKGARLGQLRDYQTVEQYAEALGNGEVAAIVDEMPYIRVFLRHYPNFTMAGRFYHTGGFGFVFPKGSCLVSPVSEAVLKLTQNETMCQIEREWFANDSCTPSPVSTSLSYNQLTLHSFRGLYLFAVSASALALAAFMLRFCWLPRDEKPACLADHDEQSGDKKTGGTAGEGHAAVRVFRRNHTL